LAHPETYLYPEYIPEEVRIRDPSKMQSKEVNTLFAFLLNRQLHQKTIFAFRTVASKDKDSDFANFSSDEESSTSSDVKLKAKNKLTLNSE
jgi:hypothetical protein